MASTLRSIKMKLLKFHVIGRSDNKSDKLSSNKERQRRSNKGVGVRPVRKRKTPVRNGLKSDETKEIERPRSARSELVTVRSNGSTNALNADYKNNANRRCSLAVPIENYKRVQQQNIVNLLEEHEELIESIVMDRVRQLIIEHVEPNNNNGGDVQMRDSRGSSISTKTYPQMAQKKSPRFIRRNNANCRRSNQNSPKPLKRHHSDYYSSATECGASQMIGVSVSKICDHITCSNNDLVAVDVKQLNYDRTVKPEQDVLTMAPLFAMDAAWIPSGVEINLIRQSWRSVQWPKFQTDLGRDIFAYVFDNAPAVMDYFPEAAKYGQKWHANPRFRRVSYKFVYTLHLVVQNLHDMLLLDEQLYDVGAIHARMVQEPIQDDIWQLFRDAIAVCMRRRCERRSINGERPLFKSVNECEQASKCWERLAELIVVKCYVGYQDTLLLAEQRRRELFRKVQSCHTSPVAWKRKVTTDSGFASLEGPLQNKEKRRSVSMRR